MAKEKCPIKEFTIFGVVFGLILCLLSYSAFTAISNSAPELFGMPRRMGFAVPLALLGLGFFASAIALQLTKTKGAVYAMIGCGFALLLGDLVIEIGVMGALFAFKLISILIYATPLLLVVRAQGVFARLEKLKMNPE